MKYLKFIIIFVVIIIIALIVTIISIANKDEVDSNNNITNTNTIQNKVNNNTTTQNNTVQNETIDYSNLIIYDGETVNGISKVVTDENMFFTIENCIQNYINNIVNRNSLAVYNQLSSNYIESKGITTLNVLNYVENISNNQKFRAIKMNYVVGNEYDQYSVYGKLLSDTGSISNLYIVININNGNLRYSIIPQINNNYTELSQIKLIINNEILKQNEDNQGKYIRASAEDIIKSIMEDYKLNALYDTPSAYKTLNEEYSKMRFENYSDYFKYVQNNVSKIQDLTLTKYAKTEKNNHIEYICVDNYDNTYTVKATGIREYEIILDDYTVIGNENYAMLNEEEKVNYNIKKIIKMFNTCDYTHLYAILNETFKLNNFATQAEFENYAKNNLFSYNVIENIDITRSEGNIYICSIILKDKNIVNANTINKSIIMKLGEGTKIEMSFDV